MRQIVLAGILTVALLLTGCGWQTREEKKPGDDNELKIGISFDSLVIERWQRDRDIFVSKAQELGAFVNIQNAGGKVAKQKEQIDYFISQKFDVIVIVAIDTKALSENVKKAKEKGIKVIAYDRLLENSNVDLYISFDNQKVGELLGKAVTKKFPKGADILAVMGSPTDHNVKLVEDGLESALKSSKSKIVKKGYAENWRAEYAFDIVSEFYDEGRTCDAVICGNDDLAAQAITALSEHQKAGSVYVIGQDGDLAACQRIVEGTQGGTVFKNVDILAAKAAEAAVKLAKGEKIEENETLSDGTYSIHYIYLQPEFVTAKNIDKEIIESGFHMKEDVYLNMKQ